MSTVRKPATCTRSQINLLRMHRAAATRLPAPDEPVTRAELRERLEYNLIYRFQAAGIIKKGRSLNDDAEYETDGHLWRVPPGVAAWVEQNVDTTLTPCGCSSGIRTVVSGETYTCRNDDCDSRFDRETAEAVVEG